MGPQDSQAGTQSGHVTLISKPVKQHKWSYGIHV